MLGPVDALLKEGLERYGTWTVDIHPQNLLCTAKGSDLVVIDFNRPKYLMMQEADAIAIDAYLPIADPFNGGRPTRAGDYVTSAYDEMDTKRPLVGQRFLEFQRLTNDCRKIEDYTLYLPPARFLVNIRQAGYALQELSRANTHQAIFKHSLQIRHHLTLSILHLLDCAKVSGSIDDYQPLASYISQKYVDLLGSFIPKEVLQAGEQWYRT